MATIKRKVINVFLIVVYSTVILTVLLIGALRDGSLGEYDSYMLPMVALEHRGSLIVVPEDIKQAQIDFERYYAEIESYDDLQSGSKLYKIDEMHYLSYYFASEYEKLKEWALGMQVALEKEGQ